LKAAEAILRYCQIIPVDAHFTFGGGREIRHSFETHDPKAAIRFAGQRSVPIDVGFEGKCRELKAHTRTSICAYISDRRRFLSMGVSA
jgi:hypothetical protein